MMVACSVMFPSVLHFRPSKSYYLKSEVSFSRFSSCIVNLKFLFQGLVAASCLCTHKLTHLQLSNSFIFESIRYRRRKYIMYSMSEEQQDYYISKAFFLTICVLGMIWIERLECKSSTPLCGEAAKRVHKTIIFGSSRSTSKLILLVQ